ncbi:MAG: hypothetical protein RR135_03640 [Oscillospiraceae bacterium]
MPHKSTQVAIGGMSAALCLSLMVLAGLIPIATYALPLLAGVMLIPAAVELGSATATVAYAAVALLSLLMVEPETALMFTAFFGYYPTLRFRLVRVKSRFTRGICKFLLFNGSMIAAYWVVIHLFGMTDIPEEFGGETLMWCMLMVGNVVFWIYDKALDNLTRLYTNWFRKKYLGK